MFRLGLGLDLGQDSIKLRHYYIAQMITLLGIATILLSPVFLNLEILAVISVTQVQLFFNRQFAAPI